MQGFEAGGKLDIADVDIGLCNLSNARLHRGIFNNVSFGKLEAFNSVLNESTFLNINWPKGYRIVEFDSDIQTQIDDGHMKANSPELRINMYSRIVDTYCQLKNLCLKQNNKMGALRFQAHELNFTYKITRIRLFKFGVRGFLENFSDGAILFTNWLFSDFGTSWLKPLGALILATFIYTAVLAGRHDLGFTILWNPLDWGQHSCDAWHAASEIFFRLLSPVRGETLKTDWMKESVNIFGPLDFFARIFTSYLIYNFLRGTRKFNFNI
ncbi:MAG: hypothetical protein JNJ75_14840 [Cyclobacteriaceae bacterium]|nr:hypothetical protein [Cyclobacteriaceae bacterium]